MKVTSKNNYITWYTTFTDELGNKVILRRKITETYSKFRQRAINKLKKLR